MPNLWTKTYQAIYEAFKGPRTVDIEFNGKVAELKLIVQHIKNITLTIKSFPQKLQGFKDFCSQICQHLLKPYPNNVSYFQQITKISDAHEKMLQCYTNCSQTLGNLTAATSEWAKLFSEVKTMTKKREEARKVHDHYEEKMEELLKIRYDKNKNGQTESNDEIQKFDRVRKFYIINKFINIIFRMKQNIKEIGRAHV